MDCPDVSGRYNMQLNCNYNAARAQRVKNAEYFHTHFKLRLSFLVLFLSISFSPSPSLFVFNPTGRYFFWHVRNDIE